MRQAWDDFRAAAAFLTVLPVAKNVDFDEARLVRSMGLFPAVGLVLGLILVVCDGGFSLLLPRAVVDGLLLLVLILVTGALHLDGVADLCDGLAGGRDRETALRIMKDSRVGAIGAVALVMVVLLKYLGLAQLPQGDKGAALLLMPMFGRWAQVLLARFTNYVRAEGGTGALFVEQIGSAQLLRASLTVLLAALLLQGLQGLLLLGGVLLFVLLVRLYFVRRLGGVSGDVLGAATEFTEIFSLLVMLTLF